MCERCFFERNYIFFSGHGAGSPASPLPQYRGRQLPEHIGKHARSLMVPVNFGCLSSIVVDTPNTYLISCSAAVRQSATASTSAAMDLRAHPHRHQGPWCCRWIIVTSRWRTWRRSQSRRHVKRFSRRASTKPSPQLFGNYWQRIGLCG